MIASDRDIPKPIPEKFSGYPEDFPGYPGANFGIPSGSRPISALDFEITHFLTSLFIEPGVTGEKV